jgi:hypothetical protein
MSKSKKRDITVLKTILRLQTELTDGLQKYKISHAVDLSKDPVIRRGLVHYVLDIFERTDELTDETLTAVEFDRNLIRDFRNTIAHNYGSMDNVSAITFINYCKSKELKKSLKETLVSLQSSLTSNTDKILSDTACRMLVVIRNNPGGIIINSPDKDKYIFTNDTYIKGLEELKEKKFIDFDGITATLTKIGRDYKLD